MAPKKDNLPLTLDQNDTVGTITYANEVIAIISGVAANEVEGIAGMCTSGGISDVFGRNKNITKGVKVEIGSEEASVDLYVIVEYGTPIQEAATNVQENVRKAIESMTGLHVVRIDVHVQGVSFEKENKETQAGIDSLKAAEKKPLPKDEAKPAEAAQKPQLHSEISWDLDETNAETTDEQPADSQDEQPLETEAADGQPADEEKE
ncbi:MAG: Asp23/Gls24 family envelope stress response protein [Clostridia bacterium]|nr:Asp23/Gls24 family envelope stress response protein [Clostridia bacterium]